mmetsp:Transcript_25335/g.35515  ORF Transcript_25335/g.35515 Transcript_25335/m.35515 type:complete len:133 (-) Transcript_25335:375-773(-)
MDPLPSLPKDVLQQIFCSLDSIRDLLITRRTCKTWKEHVDSNILIWKYFTNLYSVRKKIDWDTFPACIQQVKTGFKEKLLWLKHSEKYSDLTVARRLAMVFRDWLLIYRNLSRFKNRNPILESASSWKTTIC